MEARAEEIRLQRFASDFGWEDAHQMSGIPERARSREMRGWERFWHRRSKIKSRTTVYDFGGKVTDSAGRHSRESAIAVGKEFGMAEGNFVTKNARSEVKEFTTKM